MAADAELRLALLGAPEVSVDGVPLAVDTRKAVALLVYLALEGGTHSRDSLAGLLWPDYDNERARAALRRTLSTLRAALAGAWLQVVRDVVSLDRRGLWLDVEEFRRLAARTTLPELERAAALCRGPLLAGFALRDSTVFEDWQSFHAGTLARELTGVLDQLAELRSARSEWPAAIAHAQRRLALDPLQEPAHRRLIELYARSGERRLALDQYRACVRVLNRELGVAPVVETTALYRAIREGNLPPAPPPPAPEQVAVGPPDYPLVGRGAEWLALLEAFRRAAGAGQLVALEGEGGVGKTRLGDDLLAWAHAAGAPTVAVRCFEHETGIAYGSAIALMRAALRVAEPVSLEPAAASEAARLLPELGTPPRGSLEDPGAQARFFEGLTAVLTAALAGEQPAVVLIDDVHWADTASLEVVSYAARRLRGRRLLLILTWAPEETPPGHAAPRLAAEAMADGSGRRLALARLDVGEVAELVAFAGAPSALSARLHAETEGLPLFVVEYLKARGEDAEELPLPASVRELIEVRLAAASELGSQVLAAAAVIGRAFDAETVREVSGRSAEETVAALEELERRGIVSDGRASGYDFRHAQVRRVTYELTSSGRRRLLHGRAADVLAAAPTSRDSAPGVIAQQLLLGGRGVEAAGWFRRAGDQARALYANAEALAFYREALALGDPDEVSLHEAVGDLLTLAGDYAGALASYEAAAALAEPGALPRFEHRIGLVHHRRGEWELAESCFAAALAGLPAGSQAERARILADCSLTAHRRGRDDEARRLARRALRDGAPSGEALAQAHNILGILASGRGERRAARRHLEQSLRLADEAGDLSARAAALNNLALLDRAEGALDAALGRTLEALALCRAVGDRHREAALVNNTADLLHAVGRGGEAMEQLKSAVAIFAEIGEAGVMEPEIWKLVEW